MALAETVMKLEAERARHVAVVQDIDARLKAVEEALGRHTRPRKAEKAHTQRRYSDAAKRQAQSWSDIVALLADGVPRSTAAINAGIGVSTAANYLPLMVSDGLVTSIQPPRISGQRGATAILYACRVPPAMTLDQAPTSHETFTQVQ